MSTVLILCAILCGIWLRFVHRAIDFFNLIQIFLTCRYKGVEGPVKEKLKALIVWFQEADSGSDEDDDDDESD
jgi:hypothetical protein